MFVSYEYFRDGISHWKRIAVIWLVLLQTEGGLVNFSDWNLHINPGCGRDVDGCGLWHRLGGEALLPPTVDLAKHRLSRRN